MDETGQDLLAGACFTMDQDTDVLGGNLVGQGCQAFHFRRGPDLETDGFGQAAPLLLVVVLLLTTQGGGLLHQAFNELDVVEGFFQVFVSAQLHGPDRRFDGAESGHDNDFAGRLAGLDVFQQGQSVRIGQLQIDHGDIEAAALQGPQGLRLIARGHRPVAFAGQQAPEKGADGFLVIDDQNTYLAQDNTTFLGQNRKTGRRGTGTEGPGDRRSVALGASF